MARRIVLIGVSFILIITGVTLSAATAPAVALDSVPAAVQITCVWQRSNGQATYEVTVNSLGTLIAPNVILTHNHYGLTLGEQASDTFTISDKTGHVWRWRAVDAQLVVINAGTAMIWLPQKLSLTTAVLANTVDVQSLKVGHWLSVNYWDVTHSRLVQHDFQIIRIEEGIARLADPDRLIRPGDSGGGAYLNGQLIGNVWSINLDSDRRPLGSFNVALLPAQAQRYAR